MSADQAGQKQLRSPRRSTSGWHVAITLALLGVVLAAGYFALGQAINATLQVTNIPAGPPPAKIVMSPVGGSCRQLLMDNQTGRISDLGAQPCGDATSANPAQGSVDGTPQNPANSPERRYSIGGRTDKIRESFTKR